MVDPSAEAIEKAIRPNTNIIFTEAPTNPYLRVIDLAGVVKVAKKHKILTIIDATLASPYNLRPLEMGIDIVIHSATKYFGGHNDLLAGVTMGKHDLLNDLYRMQRMIGAVARALHLLPARAGPQDLRAAPGAAQPRGPRGRAHAGVPSEDRKGLVPGARRRTRTT